MIEKKILEMGINLPVAVAPVANYLSCRVVGGVLYVSGQLPFEAGKVKYTGKVTKENVNQAQEAARLCVINALAQVVASVNGGLGSIKSVIKLGVFVNSEGDFDQHSAVANGASDLVVKIFGETGKHVRAAVGMSSLPLNAMVEVEFMFEIYE